MKNNISDAGRFVIRALLNDYESLESLAKYHLDPSDSTFSRSDIKTALAELLPSQYIEAFLYSPVDKKFIPTNESLESSNEHWFGPSQKGREAVENETGEEP